jgi:transposase
VIGYQESSQLDVEPVKYFVLVTKREKRACRSCEDLGVVSAPLPPRIIEKCLASDRIVIDTLVRQIVPLENFEMSAKMRVIVVS